MESSVIQRIKKVIDIKGMSITTLSKKLDIVQTTLNRQISGDTTMSLTTIEAFLSYFNNISAEWLLRGDGNMYKSDKPNTESTVKIKGEFELDSEGYLKLKIQ